MAAPKQTERRRRSKGGTQNQLGQVMGAKGAQTRQRLLAATEELLKTTSLRDLAVTQIVRGAQTSVATFYVYFNDVSEAVLALISEHTQSPPSLLALFADPWPDDEAYDRANEFVAAYIENWRSKASLFRVRNLASDEGDWRFSEVRISAVSPLINAVGERIAARQRAGELPADLHPSSAAGALLAMIERIAVLPLSLPSQLGVTRRHLIEAAVFFAVLLLGGAPMGGASSNSPRTEIAAGSPPLEPAPLWRKGAVVKARARGAAGWVNQHGQAMGEKGVRTRRRLLDATEHLLRTKPIMDVGVADIAKEAAASPATFYLYFPDVSEAVLALVAELTQSTPQLMLLAAASGRAQSDEKAQEFVHSYIAHWRSHGPLFRVRNLAADEGDERFNRVRSAAIGPLTELVSAQVAECQARGRLPASLHPVAATGAVLAMIERLAVTPNIVPSGAVNLQTLSRACGFMLAALTQGVRDG